MDEPLYVTLKMDMNCKLGIDFMNNTLVKLLTISAVSLGAINVNCAKVEAVPNCVKPVQVFVALAAAFGKTKGKVKVDIDLLRELYKAVEKKSGPQYSAGANVNITNQQAFDALNRTGALVKDIIVSKDGTDANFVAADPQNGINAGTKMSDSLYDKGTPPNKQLDITTTLSYQPGTNGKIVVTNNYSNFDTTSYAFSGDRTSNEASFLITPTCALANNTGGNNAIPLSLPNVTTRNTATNWTNYETWESFKTHSADAWMWSAMLTAGIAINSQLGGSLLIGGMFEYPLNKTLKATVESTDNKDNRNNTSNNTNDDSSKKSSYDISKKWAAGLFGGWRIDWNEKFFTDLILGYKWKKMEFAKTTTDNSSKNGNSNNSNTTNTADLKINEKFDLKGSNFYFGINLGYRFTNNIYMFGGVTCTPDTVMKASSSDTSTINAPVSVVISDMLNINLGVGFVF